LRRRLGLELWYHPEFRLPISSLSSRGPLEPRRADFVAWYLLRQRIARLEALRTPRPVTYEKLARVHSHAYLESLQDAETLARIYGVDPSDIPVEEVLRTLRLGCGATVAAARTCVASGKAALNLLGGFHHAAPDRGGGLCAVNDIAVAVADLRAHGFSGKVAVIDLDAHPPDGTAACFEGKQDVWIGSLSGSNWGLLPSVDEVHLPAGTTDAAYLEALSALLARMPPSQLAFVVAGGDVLAGDAFGTLALTEEGARARDRKVHEALRGIPSVWLPGGGYQADAWRVLAGTGLVLAGRGRRPIPPGIDPLRLHFSQVAHSLSRIALNAGEETRLTEEDVDLQLGHAADGHRLLGFYSSEGIEYALDRYGFLGQLRRLGYRHFQVELDALPTGDRLRIFAHERTKLGTPGEALHLLVELVAERRTLGGHDYLFINWLALRHPLARFSLDHPQLPGQDVPGLGLSREVAELLNRIARRLSLSGVAFRPGWYHVAYAARHDFRFLDPARQGRFEALVRDLSRVSLLEATHALAEGKVRLNGQPYAWEAEDMVQSVEGVPQLRVDVTLEERERSHFTLDTCA
jgi:acetoin utilization deacetylase AcuC-like enzyme